MAFKDFMSKVRYWDSRIASLIMRHFYMLFFEVLLIIVFVALFVVSVKVVDIGMEMAGIREGKIVERLLLLLSINSIILVLLLLLNSFWMLYVFNGIIRIRSILRDISFGLSRRKHNQ